MSAIGWLDGASFTRVWGWANRPVRVHVNDRPVATITPDIARNDLQDGQRGFDAPIDPLHFVHGRNEVRVSFADGGGEIGHGIKSLDLDATPQLISGYSLMSVARGLWAVETSVKTDSEIALKGWHVAPPGAKGEVFSDRATLSYHSRHDEALQRQFWLPDDVPVHRYEARFRFDKPELKVSFGSGRKAFQSEHDCVFPQVLAIQPEKERVRRVAGGTDPLKFDMQGRTNSERLQSVFERHARMPMAEASVLDWGVGAGRVARYMAPNAGTFFGVDVDADNLAWCQGHLKGSYLHIDTDPPVPLADGQLDFIYGISVLTHLTREYERVWLSELRRLVSSRGVVALTIHGPTALMLMGLCDRQAELIEQGFVDLGENKILAGRVPDGYYRNVAQSFAHMHNVWGEFFTIVEIVPGAIGIQDLVVLRPR